MEEAGKHSFARGDYVLTEQITRMCEQREGGEMQPGLRIQLVRSATIGSIFEALRAGI